MAAQLRPCTTTAAALVRTSLPRDLLERAKVPQEESQGLYSGRASHPFHLHELDGAFLQLTFSG